MATSSHRDSIIELGARIHTLRSEFQRVKAELKQAETELDRLLNGQMLIDIQPSGTLDGGMDSSLNQKIIDLIDSIPSKIFFADEILEIFSTAKPDSVRSALARLAEQAKIHRPERGRYRSVKFALGEVA